MVFIFLLAFCLSLFSFYVFLLSAGPYGFGQSSLEKTEVTNNYYFTTRLMDKRAIFLSQGPNIYSEPDMVLFINHRLEKGCFVFETQLRETETKYLIYEQTYV